MSHLQKVLKHAASLRTSLTGSTFRKTHVHAHVLPKAAFLEHFQTFAGHGYLV